MMNQKYTANKQVPMIAKVKTLLNFQIYFIRGNPTKMSTYANSLDSRLRVRRDALSRRHVKKGAARKSRK